MPRTKEKNSAKRELNGDAVHATTATTLDKRPAKKAKLLDNTDDEGSDGDVGGVTLKVNEEYARRYEHNNKRAEQHRRM